MNSLIKVLGLLVFLGFNISVFATNEEPVFKIVNAEDKILYLDGKAMTSADLEISFQDNEGNILFSEYVIKPATFVRKYNLSELPSGTYLLFVEDGVKTYTLPVIIEKGLLKIDLQDLKIVQ